MSIPLKRIRPPLGCSKPAIRRSKVDFPEPEGPRIISDSPAGREKETRSKIRGLDFLSPKRKEISSNSSWVIASSCQKAASGTKPKIKKRPASLQKPASGEMQTRYGVTVNWP